MCDMRCIQDGRSRHDPESTLLQAQKHGLLCMLSFPGIGMGSQTERMALSFNLRPQMGDDGKV